MKSSMINRELLSALADGQLGDEEFAAALDACEHDESALGCWNTYHLIGDVLRLPTNSPALMAVDPRLSFLERLNQRLAQESPIRAQLVSVSTTFASAAPSRPVAELIHYRGPASNDGNFRWKLVAGVASLAAVSALAWNVSGLLAPASSPQLAQVFSPQIVVTSAQGPMVRDARLEELLLAHKQFGATSALQESSGFLRNATFEVLPEAQAASGR
ncbi:MAG: sigma-E factor negative regulatory protein [Polaromonas sp.]